MGSPISGMRDRLRTFMVRSNAGKTNQTVLSSVTLRFRRQNLEDFYMEHHWINMRYWLWRCVALVLFYALVSSILGDTLISRTFDVRMDHYTKTSRLRDAVPWRQQNSTQVYDPLEGKKVVQLDHKTLIVIPRIGFLVWHFIWCLMFLGVLMLDRLRPRCMQRTWNRMRSHAVFVVMFLDLLITSFLNPSVVRFMVLVYALLIRTQFMQTLVLVFVSSIAMLGAGFVSSHEYLNSVSVAEFLILNLVICLASRQVELHARLSMYRLWYILNDEAQSSSRVPGERNDCSTPDLVQRLLSLDEIGLPCIPENAEAVFQGLHTLDCADDEELQQQCSGVMTPVSNSSLRSSKSCREATVLPPMVLKAGIGNLQGMLVRTIRSATSSPRDSRNPSRSPSECGSDAATSNAASSVRIKSNFMEEVSLDTSQPLGTWSCSEGQSKREFCRSPTGDFNDESSWYEPMDVERFQLRGKGYLSDGIKVPATSSAFGLVQAYVIRTREPLYEAAGRLRSLRDFLASHPRHFFFIYNRIVPSGEGRMLNTITVLWQRLPFGEDAAFDGLLETFLNGDDKFRNLRLKHLCRLREAPSIVSNAIWMIGGERPVIIGKGYLDQRYFRGPNFLEVDVDISPSKMVKMVAGKVLSNGRKVVIEEMLVIEAQTANELPERPLGAWRFARVDAEAIMVDVSDDALVDTQPGV